VIFRVDESGRWTSSPTRDGSGPRSAASTKSPAASHAAGCAPPTGAPVIQPRPTWSRRRS
jgi:hypothetical protein